MSVSNYQYVSDAGILYQCTLPDDFAHALSLSPASGSEPYLPPEVRPRFINYRCSSPQLFRSAVVGSLATYNAAPFSLGVGGFNYNFVGNSAEVIAPVIDTEFAYGPQGVPGPTGATGATGPTGPAGGLPSIAFGQFLYQPSAGSQPPIGVNFASSSAIMNPFSTLVAGIAPVSPGGTRKFLRADVSWNLPIRIFVGSSSTLAGNTTYTWAHGFAGPPAIIQIFIQCGTANAGYVVGDIVQLNAISATATAPVFGASVYEDATNVYLNTASASFGVEIPNKSTRAMTALTLADWTVYCVALNYGDS